MRWIESVDVEPRLTAAEVASAPSPGVASHRHLLPSRTDATARPQLAVRPSAHVQDARRQLLQPGTQYRLEMGKLW